MGETLDEAAAGKMAVGKRHFRCDEYAAAVDCFQEALELVTVAHGELDRRCAEAYYFYGAALLASSRNEGIFGGAAAANAEDGDGESGEEDAAEEDAEDAPSVPAADASAGAEATKNANAATVGSSTADTSAADGGEADAGAKTEEAVENLQLAWENLECARVIYTREVEAATLGGREIEARDLRLHLAKVHLQLGELCLETESFEQAEDDFAKCVSLRTELLAADDRTLAESVYQLSLAQQFAGKTYAAVDSLTLAVATLTARKEKLAKIAAGVRVQSDGAGLVDVKGKGAASGAPSAVDATTPEDAVVEIKELDELAADLQARIDELREDQRNTASLLKAIRESAGMASTVGFGAATAPASSGSSAGASSAFGASATAVESSGFGPAVFGSSSFGSGGLSGAASGASAPINDIGGLIKRKVVPQRVDVTASGAVNPDGVVGSTPTVTASVDGMGKRKAEDAPECAVAPEKKLKTDIVA